MTNNKPVLLVFYGLIIAQERDRLGFPRRNDAVRFRALHVRPECV